MRLKYLPVIALLTLAAATRAADAPATRPDPVFEAFKAMPGADAIRDVQWPDFSKLKFVRVELSTWKGRTWVTWCQSITDQEVVLVTPAFHTIHMDRSLFSKLDEISFGEWLDSYRAALEKSPNNPLLYEPLGDHPGFAGIRPLALAIVAAQLGKNEAATDLAKRAEPPRNGNEFNALIEGIVSEAFQNGAEALENGRSRAEVLALWQNTLDNYGRHAANSPAVGMLRPLMVRLAAQVADDDKHKNDAPVDVAKLPQDQQIAFYIDRLPDLQGRQLGEPGSPIVVGLGKGTAYADALVAIGPPALPALAAHLEDHRLVRAVQHHMVPTGICDVGYVCLACIQAIAQVHFDSGADAAKWVAEHANDSPLQIQLSRLQAGSIHERIDTLHKIEKLDPKAVDPIATLTQWADKARSEKTGWGSLPPIAEELAKRGDQSLLPDMQRAVRNKSRLMKSPEVSYLCKYGDAADFHYMLVTVHEELNAPNTGIRHTDQEIAPAVIGNLRNSTNPLATPLLLEFLVKRDLTGNGLFEGLKDPVQFSSADIAMMNLIKLTGHNEKYTISDKPEERFGAMDRFTKWWDSEGKAAFVKAHPELSKVIDGP